MFRRGREFPCRRRARRIPWAAILVSKSLAALELIVLWRALTSISSIAPTPNTSTGFMRGTRRIRARFPSSGGRVLRGFEVGIQRAEGDRPSLPTAPLSMGAYDLVHSYRELGHFLARLDPLGHDRPHHPLLELANFGMTVADLDRQVGTGGFVGETD